MNYKEIIRRLEDLADPAAVNGMARFGINPENTYGISIPNLRRLAKEAGKDHTLAQLLWASGIHEARILASMIDKPEEVSDEQLEVWVRDFDSWDVCDQVCMNLFDKVPFIWDKIGQWAVREEEFVKRAAFAVTAVLAWHDKTADDAKFIRLLWLTVAAAGDERNFVKKAVNWALRHIGKRNRNLNRAAVATALEIRDLGSRSARWIAADALRELTGEAVQQRLANVKQT